jgi:hypothetical protein
MCGRWYIPTVFDEEERHVTTLVRGHAVLLVTGGDGGTQTVTWLVAS